MIEVDTANNVNAISIISLVFIGVLIFVIGQLILKLLIEPWQLQRKCIAKIAHNLIYYANVFTSPGKGSHDKNVEAAVKARELASELISSCRMIPFYKHFSWFRIFPKMAIMLEAQRNLIGLSNSTFDETLALVNANKIGEIKRLLKLDFGECAKSDKQ